MPKTAHKVVVIGHRNPDTDSICSAIAYAELKNKTSSLVCEARRAGRMNQETEFVLRRFGVQPPRMCTDVNPKIRDVDYREMPGIPGSTSLRKAWQIMRDQQIDTLSITSADNELEGIITVKDLATANMDVFDTAVLAKSRTSYKNILETLNGTMVVGNADAVCTTGHIKIGTATPEMLESSVEKGDIVILSNRYESQLCAIEKEASLLIICNGAKVGRTIQRIADETGVAIMTTPVDTYAAGKLISQCAPISYYMTRDNILKFTLVTPVADVLRVMAKVRHRYFPILDEDGKYCGMVSRRNVIALRKRRIILVDHNEATQAVEGFDQAEILEIIDHHRIGSLETSGPVYFRNQPVGCTATIVTQMYDENGVTIPQKTAGLLLAAILSDTLVFRSPTCTPIDVNAANRLAKIAGVDINEFANEMFEAGEKLDGKTTKTRTGVASGTALTFEQTASAAGFQKILNGNHTITVEVSDGKETVSTSATFTKAVHAASVTLAEPLAVEGDITVAVLQVTGSIPDDAKFKAEVTNNALDSSPVWQDATTEVKKGVNIVFENKTATNGAAFNFRVSVERGESGEGGYIEAVSGAFQ